MEEIKKVYLIYGDEEYLKEQKKNELLESFGAKGSMNFNTFEGRDIDLLEVARLADTMPFLSEHRVLLLSDTGLCKGSGDEAFLEAVSEMPESTVLILYEADADAGNKLYKLIRKIGMVLCYKKAEGKSWREAKEDKTSIKRWALDYLKQAGRKMDSRTMEELLNLTGYDMLNLQTELEKLISYTLPCEARQSEGQSNMGCPDGYTLPCEARPSEGQSNTGQPDKKPAGSGKLTAITSADIDRICSKTISDRVFDMLEAKTAGNIKKSLLLYEDMLSIKVPPMRILFMLTKQFNQVYLIKDLAEGRLSDAQMIAKLGVKDWQYRKLKEQSSRMSRREARGYLELCVEMDTKIKQGDISDRLAVEMILSV